MASAWNVPMFGFVGQSSKMDDASIYDSYMKLVPPLRRSAEVLLETLRFFGWSHVAMIGGGLPSNNWDSVGALWSSVEALLRAELHLAAAVQFDTSDPQLVLHNIQYVATVARGRRHCFTMTFDLCLSLTAAVIWACSDRGAEQQGRLQDSAAGGRAAATDQRRLRLLPAATL